MVSASRQKHVAIDIESQHVAFEALNGVDALSCWQIPKLKMKGENEAYLDAFVNTTTHEIPSPKSQASNSIGVPL